MGLARNKINEEEVKEEPPFILFRAAIDAIGLSQRRRTRPRPFEYPKNVLFTGTLKFTQLPVATDCSFVFSIETQPLGKADVKCFN
jgi:hypothetical protein